MGAKRVIKRILSRTVPIEPTKVKVETMVAVPPLPPPAGGCVVCGQPLAEGQTYVCKAHIRST